MLTAVGILFHVEVCLGTPEIGIPSRNSPLRLTICCVVLSSVLKVLRDVQGELTKSANAGQPAYLAME